VHFKRFAKRPRTRIAAGWSEPVSGLELHPLKSSDFQVHVTSIIGHSRALTLIGALPIQDDAA
jgi:hypothetical protein